jgi:hypothetical protein
MPHHLGIRLIARRLNSDLLAFMNQSPHGFLELCHQKQIYKNTGQTSPSCAKAEG